jgi:3-oxoacyl-[acyl-carrier protein] reductase
MAQAADAAYFADRVVLVTGGARGIGLATVQEFLERGARVAFCARHEAHLQRTLHQCGAPDRVFAGTADVADADQVRRFVQAAIKALGSIDVLVNNAGILHHGAFVEETYDNMARLIDVNLKGLAFVTRAVLPGMLERGAGTVINISSGLGLYGVGDLAAYCATKFGVVGFTQALDQEVAAAGVRVYAVCPGRVATDMQVQYSGERAGLPPSVVAARIVQLAGPQPKAKMGGCVEVYE